MKRTGKITARFSDFVHDKNVGSRIIRTLLGLAWGLVACAAITLLFGCATTRTVEVPVIVERAVHDTVRSVTWRSDTLVTKDTVRIMGDTVYRSVWRDRVRVYRDTLATVRIDTVPMVTEVTKVTTEYRSPWYAKAAYILGGIMVLVVLLIMKKRE